MQEIRLIRDWMEELRWLFRHGRLQEFNIEVAHSGGGMFIPSASDVGSFLTLLEPLKGLSALTSVNVLGDGPEACELQKMMKIDRHRKRKANTELAMDSEESVSKHPKRKCLPSAGQ
jgi:hypothetical protein